MRSRLYILLCLLASWIVLSSFWYTCKIKGLCASQKSNNISVEKPLEDKSKIESKENNLNDISTDSLHFVEENNNHSDNQLDSSNSINEWVESDNLESDVTAENITEQEVVEKPAIPWVPCPSLDLESVPPTIDPILFGYATTEVYCSKQLKNFAKTAKLYLDTYGGKIILIGHTDTGPKAVNNFTLGLKRAISVKKILLMEGISADQIETYSHADAEPIADNSTTKGKQQNRRVTVSFN